MIKISEFLEKIYKIFIREKTNLHEIGFIDCDQRTAAFVGFRGHLSSEMFLRRILWITRTKYKVAGQLQKYLGSEPNLYGGYTHGP